MKITIELEGKKYEIDARGGFQTYCPQMPAYGGFDKTPSNERWALAVEGIIKLGVGYYGERFLTDKKVQSEFFEGKMSKLYFSASIASVEEKKPETPTQDPNQPTTPATTPRQPGDDEE